MLLKKQITALIPLFVIVAGLLSYNFMNAQWQNPTATAPNNNTSAPLNISANYQAKLGDLGAVRMRAGEYCDATGLVCFNVENIPLGVGCPTGEAIQSISATGEVTCVAVGTQAGTYSWSTGPFVYNCASPRKCGNPVCYEQRSVVCKNQAGATVADSNCTSPKPATQGTRNNGGICSSDR